MSVELITSWGKYDKSLRRIMSLASQSLCVFDDDLARLKFEDAERAESLRAFLGAGGQRNAHIVVKNAAPLRRDSPRLMKLLGDYPHRLSIFECPEHLAALADALFIADDRHALIRFSRDHARARVIIDDAPQCAPYLHRFAEIVKEGGEQICATTLGL